MVAFDTQQGRFQVRSAGLLFHNGRVLIHRLTTDDFYAFPGGRVEMGEDTQGALVREMCEETAANVRIVRLLWMAEQFFAMHNKQYHELCFYYLMECDDPALVARGDLFHVIEGKHTLEFRWVAVEQAEQMEVYPTFIRNRLRDLPLTIEHVVDRTEESEI